MTVYQQARSVAAGPISLDGLDLDITVEKPKDDPLEFEVTTWNLSDDSWSKIETGDLCRIELGWEDGPLETVTLGEIDTLNRSRDGRDVAHTLAGVDETEAATKVPAEPQTFEGKTPGQIASQLVSGIGLSGRTQYEGPAISGTYAVTPERTVSTWLDDLIQQAANLAGVEYEWFASRGQVFFQPRSGQASSAPELSYGGMLASVGEASDTDDDTEGQLEFEALLDPRITKGAVLSVAVEGYSGAYRVSEYEMASATTNGTHEVTGTLIPVGADYSID